MRLEVDGQIDPEWSCIRHLLFDGAPTLRQTPNWKSSGRVRRHSGLSRKRMEGTDDFNKLPWLQKVKLPIGRLIVPNPMTAPSTTYQLNNQVD
jgi:hypothetical protein